MSEKKSAYNEEIKVTKHKQVGLLTSIALDENTKSGKISKRYVRQDTKEIAVIFCQLNKVGQENCMTLGHASDLLGVPFYLLKQWLEEHNRLIVENEREYLERISRREKLLLDTLFNPLNMALEELTTRLQTSPENFTNYELMKLVNVMNEEYSRVYLMRLERTRHAELADRQDEKMLELKQIFSEAQNRLIIDQTGGSSENEDTNTDE